MNCEESRKLVYLSFELNAEERKRLAIHCETCHECRTLLAEVKAQREQIQDGFGDVTLEYPTVLTASIMREIESDQKEKTTFIALFFVSRIRHALAVISLLMIAFFAYEATLYDSAPDTTAAISADSSNTEVVLNSTAVMKRVATSIEEVPATRCWKDCRPNRFTTECTQCIEKLSRRTL